jgi:hypothetical protein
VLSASCSYRPTSWRTASAWAAAIFVLRNSSHPATPAEQEDDEQQHARILRGQQQELAAQPVGDRILDLRAEHDDALVQQPRGHLVVERPGVQRGHPGGKSHDVSLRPGSTIRAEVPPHQGNLLSAERPA